MRQFFLFQTLTKLIAYLLLVDKVLKIQLTYNAEKILRVTQAIK